MDVDQHHIFARRARVPAPIVRGHLQPRTPCGSAIKPRLLISAIACLLPAATLAGPKDGQVVAGQSSISTPDANTTIIRQSTDKSVINWQSFSIGTQEYVKFVQPETSSISLNRVIGGDPSSILGTLSANGQVYLVNPNGIYFGQGAQVDVSGIVASVLDIADHDFMSGNYVFEGSADENLGNVINDGIIDARNEGYVVLMGDYSENNGVIQAHMGKVMLASGSRVTMDISGNSLISVAVDEATVSELAGVKNTGEIYADGGRVIMTARVASELVSNAVNNEGLIRANSIVEKDGVIFLTAVGGDVVNSGMLDASAADGSNVDGGGVLVYSDRDITLSSGAAIHARGDGDGSGGTVRVIAEDVLDFQEGASISVAGSPHAGGFVEVSGHGGLALRGEVDLGSGGTLLIDPATLTISAGSGGPFGGGSFASVGSIFIVGQLTAGNDVYLVASDSINASTSMTITANGAGDGDLNLVIGTVTSGGGSLGGPSSSYECSSAGFCLGGGAGFGNFSVNPDPDGNILLGNVAFNLAGGLNVAAGTMSGSVSLGNVFNAASLNVAAGSAVGSVTLGFVDVTGNVTITAGSDINFQGNVGSAGGGLTATAGNDILLNGGIGSSDNGPINGAVNLNAGNDVIINDDILADGAVNLNADNNVVIDADIIVGSNDINLRADYGDGTNSTGDGIGDVNIIGSTAESRTVSTGRAISVSGVNFNVSGASLGIVNGFTDRSIRIIADDGSSLSTVDNIVVDVVAQMNVKGGAATGTSSFNGLVDVSVALSAGNDLSIKAGSLNVSGGAATAPNSSQDGASGSVDASVSVTAGRNIVVNVDNSLTIMAGTAIAKTTPSSSPSQTGSAIANADATFSGGNNVSLNAGSINISGGVANATLGVTSTGAPCSGCVAVASANVNVLAGGNLNLTADNTTLVAGTTSTAGTVVGGALSADARVNVSGDGFGTSFGDVNVFAVTFSNTGSVAITGDNILFGGAIRGGGRLTANAGNDIDHIGSIGTAEGSFNGPVTLNADNDINIDGNIFVFDDINLNADYGDGSNSTGNGFGDVNINGRGSCSDGCRGEQRSVRTAGDLNVSGENFNVNGADFGTGSVTDFIDASVEVEADRVIVNIAGDMNVNAGRGNLRGSSYGTNVLVDTSVRINGTSLVDITAANLTVQGGTATAAASDNGATSFVTARANAELGASGGDMNVNLGGSMSLQAGVASAAISDKFAFDIVSAEANASLTAGGAISIVAPSDVSIDGGSALASARGSGAFVDGTPVRAEAIASLVAGGNLGLTVASGDLQIRGGTASANATFSSGGFRDADANASALVTAGGAATVTLTNGDLNVQAGNATAEVSASNSNSASATARADALMQLSGDLNVTLVGSDVDVRGGQAAARVLGFGGDGTSTCGNCNVEAYANGSVTANNITFSNVGGDLNVIGGNALASPYDSIQKGFASADARARLEATNDLSANLSGAVNVFGGGALAAGYWGSATTMQAFANADAVVDAGGNLDLTAVAGLNVIGGSASATPTTFSATNGTASASAKAELKAGGQATVNVTGGSIVLAGGSSNPDGSSGTTPLRKAFANASVKAVGSLQIVAASDVFGSSATIDAGGIDIAAGNDLFLSASLNVTGGNVTMTAGSDIDFQGTIGGTASGLTATAGNDILLNGSIGTLQGIFNGPVTLNANNNVDVNADIIVGSHDIGLNADVDGDRSGGVNIDSSAIIEAGGNIAISAGSDIDFRDRVWTAGGGLAVTGAGSVFLGSVDVFGDVTVSAGSNIDFQNLVQSAGGGLNADAGGSVLLGSVDVFGDVTVSAGSDIDFQNLVQSAGGGLNADAGGSVLLGSVDVFGDVTVSAGSDIDFRNLVQSAGGGLNADAGGSVLLGSVDVFGDVTVSAGSNIDFQNLVQSAGGGLNADAGGSVLLGSVDVFGDVTVSAGSDIDFQDLIQSAGGGLNATAGNDILLNGSIGNVADSFNGPVDLNANNNVDINGDIIVGSHDVNLNADVDGDSSGDVNIVGAGIEVRQIDTQGALNISGANFNLQGATLKAGQLQIMAATDVFGSSASIDAGGNITVSAGSDIDFRNLVQSAGGGLNADAGGSVLLGSVDVFGDVTVSAGSDIDFQNLVQSAGGGLNADAGGSVTLGSVDVFGDVTVSAGSDIDFQNLVQSANGGLNATAGNDILLNGSIGSVAGSFNGPVNLNANNNVDVNGDIIVGSLDVNLNADVDGDSSGDVNIVGSGTEVRRVDTQGSINISGANFNLQGATLKAGQLQIMAATDVFGSSASIDAGGIYIAAGNDLHLFNTTTTVGGGTAPGVVGDPLVLEILEREGIPLPANNDPNLKFQAGGSMYTGDIEVTASNAYLWFETDELSVGNISAPAGPLTVQYSPFTPTLDIVFEDEPPPSEPEEEPGLLARALDRPEQVSYYNSSLVASLPSMTTLVIGSAQQSGSMTVGANGSIDIGARNILLLTTPDDVSSPDNIITTGIVATSGFVASVEPEMEQEVFIAPRLESFNVETSTIWDEEERRKRQLVEKPEAEHGMCTAL